MKSLVLKSILLYRFYLSPYKGFGCAYRVHTGGKSCSELGFRAIRRFGLVKGVKILRRRFQRCKAIYRNSHSIPAFVKSQQGVCDAGCDLPCDVPDLHFGEFFDICDCCSCSDLGDWKQSRQDKRKTKANTRRHHSL